MQLEAATVGFVAAGAPLLAVSSLRGADGVDDTAVRTLLKLALQKKKDEEEEERKRTVEELRQASLARARELYGSKRKRKKRRKKSPPRASSLFRARRRHRQSCNTASMDQKDSFFVVVMAVAFERLVLLVSLLALCSLLLLSGPDARHHCWYEPEGHVRRWWVLLVTIYLALYSRLVVGPRCSASWPVWMRMTVPRYISVVVQRLIPMVFIVQKTIETLMLQVNTVIDVLVVWVLQVQVFFFSPLYLAVTCSAFACGVQDYGIFWKMASGWIPYSTPVGSTLDTCFRQFTEAFGVLLELPRSSSTLAVCVLAGFAGCDTPRAVLPSTVDVRGDSSGAFLGQVIVYVDEVRGGFTQVQFVVKVICSLLFCLVLLVRQRRKLWIFSSCRSSQVVDFPVVVPRPIPTVLPVRKTIETPQLQYVSWWSMQFVQLFLWWSRRANCGFPQLPFSDMLVTCPLLSTTGLGGSAVAVPSGCGRRCVYAATSCLGTVKVTQIQFVAGVRGYFSRHRDRYTQLHGGGDEG